jgi:serine/threonine protein kinase
LGTEDVLGDSLVNKTSVSHPRPEQLADFGLGKLDAASSDTIAAHLETCDSCRRAVEAVAGDGFVDRLREAHQGAAVATDRLANLPPELAQHPRYRIVRELGKGGMGVVYEARHDLMNRRVALKVLNRALLDHPEALKRFHEEIRNAARLSHPNIVAAHDAERVGDLHLLVMEFVEGTDLARLVGRRGPLPVLHACSYIRQAALGLQHAHEQGMVHRDLKPQNLMLTPKGRVKILDFGLAKVAREESQRWVETQSGAFMGTPDYVAPEQALNARTADIRADIYSLGGTLYFLLTGRPPFVEETPMARVVAHLNKAPVPLSELRPEVPAELSAVAAKMLAKDPAQRYQTPAEVARAVTPFCQAGSATATARPTMAGRAPAMTQAPAASRRAVPPAPAAPFEDLTLVPPPRKVRRDSPPWRWWAAGAAVAVALSLVGIVLVLLSREPGVSDTRKPPSTEAPDTHKHTGRENGSGEPSITPGAPKTLPRELENSIGMKLVAIPAGKFLMGSPPDEVNRDADEEQHEVEITQPFYMGVYEVTQEEYEKVMESNPSYFKDVRGEDTRRFPVESVSWQDAEEFCRRLSERAEEQRLGGIYRLPTEAEWEYACRGAARESLPFVLESATSSLSSDDANFDGNHPYGGGRIGPYLERTTRVGSYKPNPFGLFDMHGNVWEWCLDYFGPYPQGPQKDPTGPERGVNRILRGGSWLHSGTSCRAAYRIRHNPSYSGNYLGFRVVLAGRTP